MSFRRRRQVTSSSHGSRFPYLGTIPGGFCEAVAEAGTEFSLPGPSTDKPAVRLAAEHGLQGGTWTERLQRAGGAAMAQQVLAPLG